MKILGVETSCDETSAAVYDESAGVLSNIISSQQIHLQFGGVVPELASRAHLRKIIPIVEEALTQAETPLQQIDGFAVTYGPGLVGALLVGVNYVKALARSLEKPFVGVNHMEGHIFANLIAFPELPFPLLCLVVSGGHTLLVKLPQPLQYEVIGQTLDDAVGEAFDKVAKFMQLPYPGGPQIERIGTEGNPEFLRLPRPLLQDKSFNFSYSGLKTAVMNEIRKLSAAELEAHFADVCASFQAAAIDVLVEKTIRAARTFQLPNIAIAGGVSANKYLRLRLTRRASEYNMRVYMPPIEYCTDNAAMIARIGLERLRRKDQSTTRLNAYPSLTLNEERFRE